MITIRKGKKDDVPFILDLIKELAAYENALDDGIAKEQARALLPEGMSGTTLYMAGTLRSWVHYCELRRANGTQQEHAEIAERCWSIIGDHFPSVRKAVDDLHPIDN